MENNTNGVKKMPTPAKVSKTNNEITGLSTQMQHTQRRLDGQEKNEFVDATLISMVGGDANAAHVLKTLIHLTNDRIVAGEQQSKIYLCYTLPHWQVLHFWFWSIDLVGRLFRKLVQFGLLELSRDPVTKRNSYSVDFAQIQNLLTVRINSSCNFASWISENFGECPKNDVTNGNDSSCKSASSKQVDGQDNDVSYRNDSSCKSASSKNEQKNPENAGEQADARVNNNYIYNIPPIPIPPNLLPIPTKGVGRGKNGVVAVRVGNGFKIFPAESVDQIVASQPTPNQQDPIGNKNRSEDDKIKDEAVQILCAVNEARVSLKHLRPATDTGPLTYGYTDRDLQAIISLLQSHPEASLQTCLKVVNFRAEQIAKKPEYFRYLNASETWSVNWFCKTLDLVKKSKSNQMVPSEKTSEIKSIPVVRRPDEYKTIDYESKKQQFSEQDREETAAVIADYFKKREAKNEEDRKESAAAYWKTQEAKNGLGLISSLGIQVPAEILNEQSTDENRDYPNLNIPIIQNQIMHYPNLNDINTSNTKNQLLQKPNITKNQPTYQNDPSGNDPLSEVGGIDKNILQTEKIHNDAIAVLCAINTARTELQQLRPASDKKDDLVYEHSESNLNSIKKILSGYPKANLEICLQVVAHRSTEAKSDPESNFKHLNCHWAWTEQNFEKCLAKMKSQKLNLPKNRRRAETPTIQKQVPRLPTKQDLLEEFNVIKLITNKELQESMIKMFRNRNPDFAYEFGETINEHVKIKTPNIKVIEEVR